MSSHILLKDIVTSILDSPELAAKRPICQIASLFELDKPNQKYALPGDDCAAFTHDNGFDLLASEGIQPHFLASDPWLAGWSAVMANISDIAAMGGQPTGIVSTLWHHDSEVAKTICKGIKNACDVFNIWYGGGHLNIAPSNSANLSVAIHGKADKLLSCWHLEPDMSIYALTSLQGHWQSDNLYWNCVSERAREDLRQDWLLPHTVANRELACAAKDISNAGIVGTLIMMAELTTRGLDINLDAIRPPAGVEFTDWLRAFQSYGFVFCCASHQAQKLEAFFESSHLTLQKIGKVRQDKNVNLHWNGDSATIWQFDKESLTGLSKREGGNV